MTITIASSASAAATNVAMPAHQAGDLILVTARRANNTANSLPTISGLTFTSLQTGAANTLALVTAWTKATASNHGTVTSANASHICVLVLRSSHGGTLAVPTGGSSSGNANNQTNTIYPALTLSTTGGTSMGVRVVTRGAAHANTAGSPPSGWTNSIAQPAGASALMAVHTRAGLAANPAADTVTGFSSSPYRAHTIEITEEQPPPVDPPEYDELIDDFNRANGPVQDGAGADIWTGHSAWGSWASDFQVIGNTLGSPTGQNWESTTSKKKIQGENCDLIVKCVVPPDQAADDVVTWYMLANNVETSNMKTWGWQIYEGELLLYLIEGTDYTQWTYIGGIAHRITANEELWFSKRGNVFTAYAKPASGQWTQLFTATSNLYLPADGYFGLQVTDATQRWDDLRGGPLAITGPEPDHEDLIDNFNRTDGNLDAGDGAPIWVSGWINSGYPGSLRVISNTLGQTASGWNQGFVRPTFKELQGPDCDVLIDCVTSPGGAQFSFWIMLQNPGSEQTGLRLAQYGTEWYLSREVAGVGTNLAGEIAPGIASGDSLWFAKRGNVLAVGRRPSGGHWTEVISTANIGSPATSWTTGAIGIELSENTSRWDNLRGGPFVEALPPGPVKAWDGTKWASGNLRRWGGDISGIREYGTPAADRNYALFGNGGSSNLMWKGIEWNVKRNAGGERVGPGNNFWSNNMVFIDGQDRLHLKIAYNASRNGWECAEIISKNNFGYGRYEWTLDTPVDPVPLNVVVGLFTWDSRSSDSWDYCNREIDIEFARWSYPQPTNGHWSSWPSIVPDPAYTEWRDYFWSGPSINGADLRYTEADTPLPTKHWFDWRSGPPRSVTWTSPTGSPSTWKANPQLPRSYSGATWNGFPDGQAIANVGDDGPSVDMNLWISGTGGQGPGGTGPIGGEVDFIIRDFRFISEATMEQAGGWVPAKVWDGSKWI